METQNFFIKLLSGSWEFTPFHLNPVTLSRMNIFKQPLFFSESDPLVDGRGTEDVTSQECFICRLRDMYVVHSMGVHMYFIREGITLGRMREVNISNGG